MLILKAYKKSNSSKNNINIKISIVLGFRTFV